MVWALYVVSEIIDTRGAYVGEGDIIGGKMDDVDDATLGADTGYGSVMVSIRLKHILQRLVIASSWALQVTAGSSVIAHASMGMA